MVLLLGACPFPERLDLQWFSSTLAELGPGFHTQAVRAALCIPSPTARTAAVLKAITEGGVAATVALDELCPVMAGSGDGDVWCGGPFANQVGVVVVTG